MNPELMIPVERAVRPLIASHRRKLRMREELYQLISDRYEDRLAAGESESAALRQAVTSFGDPASLSEQLQQTVPRREYWSARWDRFLFSAQSTPTWRDALRSGFLLAAPVAVWLAILPAVVVWIRQDRTVLQVWPVFAALALAMGINTMVVSWLAPRTVQRMLAGNRLGIFRDLLVVACVFALTYLGLQLAGNVAWAASAGWRLVLGAWAAAAIVYPGLCWLVSVEHRQRDVWERLPLSDDSLVR